MRRLLFLLSTIAFSQASSTLTVRTQDDAVTNLTRQSGVLELNFGAGLAVAVSGNRATITNTGDGVGAVDSVFTRTGAVTALGADYAAFYALRMGSNGILVCTGTACSTTTPRTITGTATKITVTNGDGVSGNPTITIPDSVTLVTPTISATGFTNAVHAHTAANSGGQLSASNVFSGGTVPTARLGSGVADSTTFLRGDGTWDVPAGGGGGSGTVNSGASTCLSYYPSTGTTIDDARNSGACALAFDSAANTTTFSNTSGVATLRIDGDDGSIANLTGTPWNMEVLTDDVCPDGTGLATNVAAVCLDRTTNRLQWFLQGASVPKLTLTNGAAEISALTEKTVPVAADLLVVEDSAASNAKKKVQLDNLPVSAATTTALNLKAPLASPALTGAPTSGGLALAVTVASGTKALDTDAIASEACDTMTATATGAATTDIVTFTPNADITAVTGYAPETTGGLAIYTWLTTNTLNIKVCNPTSSSVTPGAVSLNWRITR